MWPRAIPKTLDRKVYLHITIFAGVIAKSVVNDSRIDLEMSSLTAD
jgi:hypothetical protein